MSQEVTLREALTMMVGVFPEPDEDSPMTATELRMVRDYLGLTGEWLAEHLDVALRTVRRWEHSYSPVPDGIREAIEALEAQAAVQVGELVGILRDANVVTLMIPDGDWLGFPPGWWRMIAARVAAEVPGLAVDSARVETQS